MRDYAEVFKALRRCRIYGCSGCYLRENQSCKVQLRQDAADAIEELLAKVESYENQRVVESEMVDEMYAENERLKSKVPRWISVEDEPPKENGRYLVRYKRDVNLGDEETVHEDEIRIMRFFVDDGWRYPIICNDHVRLVNEEVTHWMPLPESPKEETE